jgi:DNA-binding Lrp family transcriptional regulator
LTNHAHVLVALHANPDQVLREVARRIGITERAVQRIVLELEEEGFLCRERVGRRNRYQISHDMSLRHPIEAHCTIDGLLNLVAGGAPARKQRSRVTRGEA